MLTDPLVVDEPDVADVVDVDVVVGVGLPDEPVQDPDSVTVLKMVVALPGTVVVARSTVTVTVVVTVAAGPPLPPPVNSVVVTVVVTIPAGSVVVAVAVDTEVPLDGPSGTPQSLSVWPFNTISHPEQAHGLRASSYVFAAVCLAIKVGQGAVVAFFAGTYRPQ